MPTTMPKTQTVAETPTPTAHRTTAPSLHPEVDAWLAARPADPDLDRLMGVLAASEAEVAETRRRLAATRTRAADVERELMTAAELRTPLVEEKLRTDVEMAVLPRLLEQAEANRLRDRLACLAHVREMAETTERDLTAERDRDKGRWHAAAQKLNYAESFGAGYGPTQDERDVWRRELNEIGAVARPLMDAAERARIVEAVCRLTAQRIGPEVELRKPDTWTAVVERTAAALAKGA